MFQLILGTSEEHEKISSKHFGRKSPTEMKALSQRECKWMPNGISHSQPNCFDCIKGLSSLFSACVFAWDWVETQIWMQKSEKSVAMPKGPLKECTKLRMRIISKYFTHKIRLSIIASGQWFDMRMELHVEIIALIRRSSSILDYCAFPMNHPTSILPILKSNTDCSHGCRDVFGEKHSNTSKSNEVRASGEIEKKHQNE